jgi:hypothetical protein
MLALAFLMRSLRRLPLDDTRPHAGLRAPARLARPPARRRSSPARPGAGADGSDCQVAWQTAIACSGARLRI